MNHTEFLQDFIDTYVADPSKRAATKTGTCQYLTEDGRKCAIGRHILPGTYNERCETRGVSLVLCEMSEMFPDWMKKLNRKFLAQIQIFHDNNRFWNNCGLSPNGSHALRILKRGAKELDEES